MVRYSLITIVAFGISLFGSDGNKDSYYTLLAKVDNVLSDGTPYFQLKMINLLTRIGEYELSKEYLKLQKNNPIFSKINAQKYGHIKPEAYAQLFFGKDLFAAFLEAIQNHTFYHLYDITDAEITSPEFVRIGVNKFKKEVIPEFRSWLQDEHDTTIDTEIELNSFIESSVNKVQKEVPTGLRKWLSQG